MRPAEVCRELQVSRTTLINMEERGELHPIYLPSGHRRYLRSEINSLLNPHAPSEDASRPSEGAVSSSAVA
jgi:predicted site-specific integrase-resolvase